MQMGFPFSKHAVIAAGILLVVAAVFSHAFEFGLSADAVSASWCTQGTVNAWISGAAPGSNAYFSAQTGYASASFANPATIVSVSGTASTEITMSVPQCSYGSHLVTVTAQVCQPGADCQRQSRTILVQATSCPDAQCSQGTYATGETKIVYPTPQPTSYCGDAPCAETRSNYVREAYFAPTGYGATLERIAAQRCVAGNYCSRDQLVAGETIALQIFARNRGAASGFEVRADTASANLVVIPKGVSFEMARGEKTALDFLIAAKPESVQGTYPITFSLWHNGVKLDELTQWVDVVSYRPSGQSAKLLLPPGIVVSACLLSPQVTISASLFNPGSSQTFLVNSQLRGQTVSSRAVSVGAGATEEFQITFDSRLLSHGDNWLDVSATSSEFEGSGRINAVLAGCGTAAANTSTGEALSIRDVLANQSGNRIEIVATVSNDGTTSLERVTRELQGLPSSWTQYSNALSLAPGQQANLTFTVITSSNEVVRPTLLVKNEGRTLATRQLGEINNQASGLTGLFTLGDSAMVAIIVFLMLVAAALLFAASSENDATIRNLQAARPKA